LNKRFKKFTFLFAEISNTVTALRVSDRHNIEKKGFNIVVKRFGIEEALGQQAEILAVSFLFLPIHFPNADLFFPGIECKRRPCQA
jgi:hypothetical protein